MKTSLVALILTLTLLGQYLSFPVTRAQKPDQKEQPSESAQIARLETLLDSLREELKIPAYSLPLLEAAKVFSDR